MQLTEAQKEAIAAPVPKLQILACAGSGKTEVLARRTVRYLLEGVQPDSIVAFTFTEKAAGELKDRIEQRATEADERFRALPPSAAGLFVGTIHSYCLHLLQECGGIYEIFDPLSEEREWALLHRFGRRLGLVELMTQTWPGRPVSVRRAVEIFRRSLAVVYNERIPRWVLEARVPAFAGAIQRYEELLARMQLLSFDQMIERACAELAPGGKLRQALDGRVREVLVDEYQDLNWAQEELLQRLVDLGAHLTVVGDDEQAIYQWRGGDVSLFLRFPERHPQAQRRELAENHRSLPPIVTVATSFATTIRERVPKSMIAARAGSRPAIELVAVGTPEEEAEHLVQRMRALLDAGHRPADIAVLYRSVRTSARPLVAALRKEGLPFALTGRLSLLDRPEMALLTRIFVLWAGGTWQPDEEREVVTPERLAEDIADLTGVSGVRAGRIVAELEQLGSRLLKDGVWDLIGTYLEMLRIIGLPTQGLERQRQEQGLGRLSQLLTDFEHAQRRAAPADWLRVAIPSASEEAAEDAAVLASRPEGGEPPVARPGMSSGEVFLARLRVFLEEFASQAAEETPLGPTLDRDAVNIMTIHQAKGLEFPIVFVPALVERRFPSARMGREEPWYIPADLFAKERYQGREDDERRLFYVAMTRARELLVLSWFTAYPRGTADCSRFVKDLARMEEKEHLQKGGTCRPTVYAKSVGEPAILDTDFGQLLTFSECPYKFYLRHVCGFEPPLALELGYGKVLHHVVAELARRSRGMRTPTSADVDEILSQAFYLPFASPIAHEQLYKAARRRLVNYVRNHGHELVRTIEPERRFEVPMGLARVRGRIDLILQAEGSGSPGIELVDFKTAANRPPSRQHQNQLRMYAEAVRALGMNPIRLAIHDLDADNGGRILVEESESEVAMFRAELRQWLEEIHAGRFPSKRSGLTCPSCDFQNLCQAHDRRSRSANIQR